MTLLTRQQSCLLIVDVQEKLTPRIQHHDNIIIQCSWLMRLARELNVPIHLSEQYPQGLGKTVSALRSEASDATYSSKMAFSCAADAECLKKLDASGKNDMVIAGIETHVCILQTALELQALGKNVFVVVDAVGARHEIDHRYGLKRMKSAGITLITHEMVFFEWLRHAGTPDFKKLSQQFLSQHTESKQT